MPLDDVTLDRLLAHQVSCAENGQRPPYALFGLVAAIARASEPVGLRYLARAAGMTDQGVLNLIETGKQLGVIQEVPVGKRPKYLIPPTLNSVERSSDNNAQVSRALADSTLNSVEHSTSTTLKSVERSSASPAQRSTQLTNSVERSSGTDVALRAHEQGTSSSENIKPSSSPKKRARLRAPASPPPVESMADAIYHELTSRHLPREIRPKWDESLARYGEPRMREVVVCWRAAGFNPTNHKGQLDWMRKGVPAKNRLDSDEVYETKTAAADLAEARGNGNGFTTKADRNRDRLREVAEDIAGLRSGDAGATGEAARDHHEKLLGDEPGSTDTRRADASRFGLGGDRRGDPDVETSRPLH